jgi:hypothetical protein
MAELWRVGRKVPINVYEGDRPVCQCQTEAYASLIVDAVNYYLASHAHIWDAEKDDDAGV